MSHADMFLSVGPKTCTGHYTRTYIPQCPMQATPVHTYDDFLFTVSYSKVRFVNMVGLHLACLQCFISELTSPENIRKVVMLYLRPLWHCSKQFCLPANEGDTGQDKQCIIKLHITEKYLNSRQKLFNFPL